MLLLYSIEVNIFRNWLLLSLEQGESRPEPHAHQPRGALGPRRRG